MNDDATALSEAQDGLKKIENAILRLLDQNPGGLRNSEIADLLHLRSDFLGRQKDWLTYSLLGGLIAQGRVSHRRESRYRVFTKA